MKELIIHIGYPKTGSTMLRHFLFPRHSELNYLGRFDKTINHLKITELLVKLTNTEYNKKIDLLIEIAKNLKLSDKKTNLIADEFIVNYSIHYDNGGDNERTIARTISRAKYIFNKANINLKICFMTRNQSELIPSFYSNTAPELKKSMKYNGDRILKYFNGGETNNFYIKRFCEGLKFSNLYKELVNIVGKENLKVFIFDKAKFNFEDYISDVSEYLKINKKESIKLVKSKNRFTAIMYMNEDLRANSPISVLISKIIRNIKNPSELLVSFSDKIKIMNKLIKLQFSSEYKNNKEEIIITKKKLINQYKNLKNNSKIIKEYYKKDSEELEKFLNENLNKYNYY